MSQERTEKNNIIYGLLRSQNMEYSEDRRIAVPIKIDVSGVIRDNGHWSTKWRVRV
jgi:hypothetical protein